MFMVFIVDDDAERDQGIVTTHACEGLRCPSIYIAHEFLAHHDTRVPGCAVFDVSMSGLDGFELQQESKRKRWS